jgi:flagellar basal-body rod protein FlgC
VSDVAAIAASGLVAATLKLSVSASNIANAGDEARIGSKSAYQPRATVQTSVGGGGVVARAVTAKPASLIAYDPTSPLADANGLILAPEIDPINEISNHFQASQAFAFSLEALKVADENDKTLLDMTA